MKCHKFLLCTWGSSGDLYPFLSLGNELRRRGHAVAMAGFSYWEEKTREAGIRLLPMESPFNPADLEVHPDLFSQRNFGLDSFKTLIRDFALPTFEPWTDQLLAQARDFDCMVAHGFALFAPIIAEKTGVRFASATLSPGAVPSDFSLPAGIPLQPFKGKLGRHLNRWIWKAGQKMVRNFVDPEINRLRSSHHLPTIQDTAFKSVSPHLHLQLYSRYFAPPQPDWHPSLKQAGFCFWDESDSWSPPDDLSEFLGSKEKPVLFTLGTSAVLAPGHFYEEAVQAAKLGGYRAILLLGRKTNRPTNLPSNVFALDYAPHRWIMPRCSVVVHHCGMGTSSQALRAGVPSVLCPFAFDQPDNALRIEALGAGIRVSPKKRNARRILEAIERVTDNPRFRNAAQEIARKMESENGPSTAADHLEELARNF